MLSAQERAQHREKINTPETWPYWPALPIKRSYNGSMQCAWITADYPTVVLESHPTIKGIIAQLRFEMSDEELAELGFFDPRKIIPNEHRTLYAEQVMYRYEDIDALLDDGWVVD